MNNTALSAGAENANQTNMVFESKAHETFYYEKLSQARYQDAYHEALLYILGISEDTRAHFDSIYDMKSGCIQTECLKEGWQTSGSMRVVRLAFNGVKYRKSLRNAHWREQLEFLFTIYTDGTPSVGDYKRKDEQIDECNTIQRIVSEYSVSDIFCCGYAKPTQLALYFWQGIRLRYPEYCRRQKSMDEILAEWEEKRHVKNSVNGNKE